MKIRGTKASVLVGVLAIISLAAGAAIFQPWKLFIDTEIQEQIPTVQESPSEVAEATNSEIAPTEGAQQEESGATQKEPANDHPKILSQGSFISHEHATSGTVKILELADGSRILRIENLDTSDGPKLEVWLTDAPVIAGQDGWFVFDDGKQQSLGALKGNKGNQNYVIPANLNLSDYSSVSIWCVTFKVSFGAAELIKQ
jgi:hypothetical protein